MTSRNANPAINKASLSTETNSLASLLANSTRVVVPQAPAQIGGTAVFRTVQSLSDKDLTSMVNGNLLDVAFNSTGESFTANADSNSLAVIYVNASGVTETFAAMETAMSTRAQGATTPSNGPWQKTDGSPGAPGVSTAGNYKPYDMDNGGTATFMSIHEPLPVTFGTGAVITLGANNTIKLVSVNATSAAVNYPFACDVAQTWNGSGTQTSKVPPTAAQGLFGFFGAAGPPNTAAPRAVSTMVGCMVKLTSTGANALTFHSGPASTDPALPPGTPCMITVVATATTTGNPQTLTIVSEAGNVISAHGAAAGTGAYEATLELGRRTTLGGIGVAGSAFAPQANGATQSAILTPTLPNATSNEFFEYFGVGMDTQLNAYSLHDALFGNSHERGSDKSCILRMQEYAGNRNSIDMFLGTVNAAGAPNTDATLTTTPADSPAAVYVRFARVDFPLANTSALANADVAANTRTYFAISAGGAQSRAPVILAKWNGTNQVMTFVLSSLGAASYA